MLIIVDHNNGVPVYKQLVDQIRFQIAGGILEAGSELPSTRVLAQDLRLNHMTVSKAYVILEKEGLIERRPGRPQVVRELSRAAADEERQSQLRLLLEPVVVATRQLEITPAAAARIYRQMLEESRREVEVP